MKNCFIAMAIYGNALFYISVNRNAWSGFKEKKNWIYSSEAETCEFLTEIFWLNAEFFSIETYFVLNRGKESLL